MKNEKEKKEEVVREKNKEEKPRRLKMFLNFFIFIILLCISIFMYAKYIGVMGLRVREYRITSEDVPSNYSGIKIVHFSDLLYGSVTFGDEVSNLVNRINEIKPDLVLFTGGLISDGVKLSEDEVNNLSSELFKIDASIGKYAVKGDEDTDEFSVIMDSSEFKVLSNTGEFVYNKGLIPIYIGGFASSIKDTVNVESTFLELDKDVNKDAYYKIVLMHEGDSVDTLLNSRSDINLVLAGNSLNGSVIVPFYGGLYIPNGSKKYYEEYYKRGESEIFVSGGIGTNEFGYRFLNKPSFNLYRLKSL